VSVFHFQYERVQSPQTGLFTDKPMITLGLRPLDQSVNSEIVANVRFRVDTGADYSTAPLQFAASVLDVTGTSSTEIRLRTLDALQAEMGRQNLKPIRLVSATGNAVLAYPLWIPVEIADDAGAFGQFDALIGFGDGPYCKALAGLTGFLDKFDLQFEATRFAFGARGNSGV